MEMTAEMNGWTVGCDNMFTVEMNGWTVGCDSRFTGEMNGWMVGCDSSLEDCLPQSKIIPSSCQNITDDYSKTIIAKNLPKIVLSEKKLTQNRNFWGEIKTDKENMFKNLNKSFVVLIGYLR